MVEHIGGGKLQCNGYYASTVRKKIAGYYASTVRKKIAGYYASTVRKKIALHTPLFGIHAKHI